MLSMPRIVRPDLSGGEPDKNWFPRKTGHSPAY